MATKIRELKTANEIHEEVVRVASNDPNRNAGDGLPAIGHPVPLAQPDENGCNWTMHMPGTAYQVPLVLNAINDVAARWNLKI